MLRYLLCGITLLSTGCLKTYVYRSPDLSPDATLSTLMVHTGVQTEQTREFILDEGVSSISGNDIALLASDIAQNRKLDQFGMIVMDSSEPFLTSQGLDVVIDTDRAKALRKFDWTQFQNNTTVISGNWVDPRGNVMPLVPGMPLRNTIYSKLGKALHAGGAPEGYLYVVADVHERGLFRRYPKLSLTFVVHDELGQELLVAQGVGKGQHNFLVTDRSPENLSLALGNALESLSEAEVLALTTGLNRNNRLALQRALAERTASPLSLAP
ncbi:MAG: hypothetical protein VX519_08410 [Myxococcota bacterium]|nr:hypothetical protein [Myxococcota bacterium]